MNTKITIATFDHVRESVEQRGAEPSLEFLRQTFSESRQYHQLFEIMKMQARLRTGLPLLYEDDLDQLDSDRQKQFENLLLDACCTVGKMFFEMGDVRSGWMYFQPVGDNQAAAELLRSVDVNEDNLDDIVQIAVTEGVAPAYGYQLMLAQFGTCNSITAFDSQISMLPLSEKQVCAELLVDHLYREIKENVISHIEDQEKSKPKQQSLLEIIADRDWLFANGGHHVDTTHLASTVRIARFVRDPEILKLAVELAEYGLRLDEQFHFQGDEPFEDAYPDHLQFFRGLLGNQPEKVEAWFHKKISAMESGMVRSLTIEMLIDFLARIGRNDRAIQLSLSELDEEHQSMGLAPGLFDLAKQAPALDQLADHFKSNEDLLSYSIALLLKNQKSANGANE